jgi:hypothetical protein
MRKIFTKVMVVVRENDEHKVHSFENVSVLFTSSHIVLGCPDTSSTEAIALEYVEEVRIRNGKHAECST